MKTSSFFIIFAFIIVVLMSGCTQATQPKDYTCQQDSDCVFAIEKDGCCRCPMFYQRQYVEDSKDLVVYLSDEYYALPQGSKTECEGMLCKMCMSPEMYDLKCVEGQCRMVLKENYTGE